MNDIYIALGANLSNPKETFIKALDDLAQNNVVILDVSGLWQSPSWPPGLGHPDYLNAAARIDFDGSAPELLRLLNTIEADFGRLRAKKNDPRPLDLDIISFRDVVIGDAKLTIPHPRMFSRGFVLFPLEQVAPDWRNPIDNVSISNYIAALPLSDVAPMKYIGTFYHR